MSGRCDVLEERVRAFRTQTGKPSDGRATRARVLAAAQVRERQWRWRRPAVPSAVAALVVVLSSAGALTAIGRWRAAPTPPRPAAVARNAPASSARPASDLAAPVPSADPPPVDASAPASPSPAAGSLEEERAYARAHRLHFGGGDPRAALAAWNAYLSRHPRGGFVPEARYNRALTLLRLGRQAQAVEALRPFAAGAFGAYRRAEAAALIESATGP